MIARSARSSRGRPGRRATSAQSVDHGCGDAAPAVDVVGLAAVTAGRQRLRNACRRRIGARAVRRSRAPPRRRRLVAPACVPPAASAQVRSPVSPTWSTVGHLGDRVIAVRRIGRPGAEPGPDAGPGNRLGLGRQPQQDDQDGDDQQTGGDERRRVQGRHERLVGDLPELVDRRRRHGAGRGQPIGDLVGAADGIGGRGERLRRQALALPAAESCCCCRPCRPRRTGWRHRTRRRPAGRCSARPSRSRSAPAGWPASSGWWTGRWCCRARSRTPRR